VQERLGLPQDEHGAPRESGGTLELEEYETVSEELYKETKSLSEDMKGLVVEEARLQKAFDRERRKLP